MTMAYIAVGTTAFSLYGSYEEAKGQKKAGKAAKKAAYLEAEQYEKRAEQEVEAGAREAIEIRRQGERIRSDARAAMAASGGVADDVGAIKADADIASVIDYNAMMAIYEGKKEAEQSREAAEVIRAGGRAAEKAGKYQSRATMLKGATSGYLTYRSLKG